MRQRIINAFRRLARFAGRESRGLLFNVSDILGRPREENQSVIRNLCSSTYVGNDTVLCRALGRYKMFVDANDVGHSPHLMLDGYWEMWVTEELARNIRPGMVVADIGANLGYFTVLMADLVGETGRVHAFEPNPPIAARLRKSVDVNGFGAHVTVHETALSDEDGRAIKLFVPENEPKNAHVIGADRLDSTVELITRRFDSYTELMDVDLIKIDAEAAERDIWRGMTGMLDTSTKPLTILMEFTAARYADAEQFLDEIIGRGFSLEVITLADGVLPTTKQQILAAPPAIDQMLLLRR